MWIKVCEASELLAGGSREVIHEDKHIGVFRTVEGLFAVDNLCPHHGAQLHYGHVRKGTVHCPWHDWPFRLKDGECLLHAKFNLTTYTLKEDDGFIWVATDGNKSDQA